LLGVIWYVGLLLPEVTRGWLLHFPDRPFTDHVCLQLAGGSLGEEADFSGQRHHACSTRRNASGLRCAAVHDRLKFVSAGCHSSTAGFTLPDCYESSRYQISHLRCSVGFLKASRESS